MAPILPVSRRIFRYGYPLVGSVLIWSCLRQRPVVQIHPAADSMPALLPANPAYRLAPADTNTETERRMIAAGLVDVHSLDTLLLVELKYSTTDNFLGFDIYGALDKCYLQPDVAEKLVRASGYLQEEHPGYRLLVYDGARPRSIQQRMWDTVKTMPVRQATYVSNPQAGSLHNYGAAVDLTICDSLGHPLDMGTPYDYFGDRAHTDMEAVFLASGELTLEQVNNRKLLRRVMRKAGFSGIETEWWHFNSCSRETAAVKYSILE